MEVSVLVPPELVGRTSRTNEYSFLALFHI
jgi:hypothetical protein